MSDVQEIKSKGQFKKSPEGMAERWKVEIESAKDSVKDYHKQSRDILKVFLDKRDEDSRESRVNLFSANTITTKALLYGKTPQVDVDRRFGDMGDSTARCAATIMQRLLNTDIERDDDGYARALRNALGDRLTVGIGVIRQRYVMTEGEPKQVAPKYKTRTIPDPDTGEDVEEQETDDQGNPIELAPGYEEATKAHEDVETIYVHWEDFLWSVCRTWEECRWVAFKNAMTRDGLRKRFKNLSKKELRAIPLNSKLYKDNDALASKDPWARADVWEIWSKDDRKVYWYVEGYDKILDVQDDPYELEAFWPCPQPLFANLTTSALMPRADYILAQDLYKGINVLESKIRLLEDAINVRGVFNANVPEIARVLSEASGNEMIPAADWPAFAEKGGFKGNIDWFPIDMIVAALDKLVQQRDQKIALLYQVTGMSDILRGQAQAQATATEQAIKAKFASVRVQDFQEEFATFASAGQRIKGELVCKLYDDQTIMTRSNIGFTADAQNAPAAVQMLRDEFSSYRIKVKPESVSLTDYAALKQERTELMTALSQILGVVLQIGQSAPGMVPFLLQMLKWMFTGFRGSAVIEPIMDEAIKAAEQMAQQAMQKAMQPPPPDPKLQAAQVKAGAEVQKSQMDIQASIMEHMAKMKELLMEMEQSRQEHEQGKIEHVQNMQREEAALRREAVAPRNGEGK